MRINCLLSTRSKGRNFLPANTVTKKSAYRIQASQSSFDRSKNHIALWHGMFGQGEQMEPMMRHFNLLNYPGQTFSLLLHDVPPRIKKGPPEGLGRMGLQDYATDIAMKLVNYIGLMDGPLIPMGHSMGGAVLIMLLTAMHRDDSLQWVQKLPVIQRKEFLDDLSILRDRVKGAVLIEPGPPKGVLALPTKEVLRNFSGPVLKAAILQQPFRLEPKAAANLLLNAQDPKDIPAILNTFRWDSGRAAGQLALASIPPFSWRMKDLLLSDISPRLPVLVLGGTEDRVVPKKVIYRIAKTIPNCEVEIIDGADHWLPGEKFASQAVKRIDRYIEDRVSPLVEVD